MQRVKIHDHKHGQTSRARLNFRLKKFLIPLSCLKFLRPFTKRLRENKKDNDKTITYSLVQAEFIA